MLNLILILLQSATFKFVIQNKREFMASHLAQGRRMIENMDIHHKNFAADGTSKNSKPGSKKGGTGFGSRKALNDITNKSSIRHEASLRKTNLLEEKFNIGEEMFLHDHKKCVEAQLKVTEPCFWDTVLPESRTQYFRIDIFA
ncbi:protein PATRONUS 2-like [Actinidia eriantha]|uniref:protein PATRONUS 2-like n=1 Tax=Actinidia eriantha TaxID=165200 RepID=UPI00258B5DA5|nr:protein PATRONUS 2-like [Actinidia eriantha]